MSQQAFIVTHRSCPPMQLKVRAARRRLRGELPAEEDEPHKVPGTVQGVKRFGMVFQSEFDVYTTKEFWRSSKTAPTP